jgi:hypothetical protein
MVKTPVDRKEGKGGPFRVKCQSCDRDFTVGAPDYRPFDAVCPWCLTPNSIDW